MQVTSEAPRPSLALSLEACSVQTVDCPLPISMMRAGVLLLTKQWRTCDSMRPKPGPQPCLALSLKNLRPDTSE